MTRQIAAGIAIGVFLGVVCVLTAVIAVSAETPTPVTTFAISAATPPAPSASPAQSYAPGVQLTPRPPKTGGGRNVEPEVVNWATIAIAGVLAAVVFGALTTGQTGGGR